MKKIFLASLFFAFSLALFGQQPTATWQIDQKKTSDGNIELVFTATIANSWYMYSVQEVDGPMPTTVSFTKSADFTSVGKLAEGIPSKKKFDEAFEINVQYYEGKAVFVQKIKRTTDKEFTINGTIEYQTCSGMQCVPNDYPFTVKIQAGAVATTEQTPASTTTAVQTDVTVAEQPVTTAAVAPVTTMTDAATEPAQEESIWLFLILAIGAGLGAILTPCVFPMIPMTASFFMQGSSSKAQTTTKALIFAISVGVIYGLVGCVVAIFKNPAIANIISASWYMNLIFAAMFIVFAMSFFGLFEITLPTGLANKADRQADKGGYIASFFMAVALAIISFSCTGPFVGALLPMAASGTSIVKPILGLFLFGFALASPFLIVAIFPSLMNKLKSGSWLNSVKVVFAFVMLGFCVKFLNQVDVDANLNIITREVAIAFWIVLSILLGLYILGKIKFSHDSEVKYVSVGRLFIAIVTFVFAAYLVPGLFGAELQAVSAFLPAKDKQQFDLTAVQATAGTAAVSHAKETPCGNTPKYAETKMHTPAGIKGYFDMQEAIACAKQLNRPILVDVTGFGCTNCKKMESSTFKDPRIAELVNAEFVWVSLFYDDKTELPAAEQTDKIRTVGHKVRDYQQTTFASVGGPYFAILTADGAILKKDLGLCSADEFLAFANEGLQKFKEIK